jgi:GntR family transcriptional regulator
MFSTQWVSHCLTVHARSAFRRQPCPPELFQLAHGTDHVGFFLAFDVAAVGFAVVEYTDSREVGVGERMTVKSGGRSPHRYEEIAAALRDAIVHGRYKEGDQLPGENAIMQEYSVAHATARDALAVLRHEVLAIARPGAGVFVAPRRRIVRDSTSRYSRKRAASTSPFRSDAQRSGQRGEWEHESRTIKASPEIARRLGLPSGAPVMETTYRYFADGRPVQLSQSWEPLSITERTPIEYPEDGAAIGVIARMDLIGYHVDRVVERVTARAARLTEVEQLDLPRRGAYVLVIDRTHYAGDEAVETCDVIFPGDRYELTYTIPVHD